MPKPEESKTKFIGRNRAPRVHIEYDVETWGSQRKIELPFVMGVMADLSGKINADNPLDPVEQRKFSDIDMDNFDDYLKKTAPRAAFNVENELAPGSRLAVDLTFKSIEDFSPDRVAENIEPLRKLLEARRQLSNLLTFMDGKMGAENLLEDLLKKPALMQSMMAAPKPPEITPGTEAESPAGSALEESAAPPEESPTA